MQQGHCLVTQLQVDKFIMLKVKYGAQTPNPRERRSGSIAALHSDDREMRTHGDDADRSDQTLKQKPGGFNIRGILEETLDASFDTDE